eukprot:TRINITY_DN43053_c0_g1_i1.p1 TRINITY_DN43053_c0_g1~~TRINITY_DN43053_c0_g1_i1.p1  ORF type:complete len:220 (-),score=56.48 TRINITY_DN43053_c0_g1_i1:132-791(-)
MALQQRFSRRRASARAPAAGLLLFVGALLVGVLYIHAMVVGQDQAFLNAAADVRRRELLAGGLLAAAMAGLPRASVAQDYAYEKNQIRDANAPLPRLPRQFRQDVLLVSNTLREGLAKTISANREKYSPEIAREMQERNDAMGRAVNRFEAAYLSLDTGLKQDDVLRQHPVFQSIEGVLNLLRGGANIDRSRTTLTDYRLDILRRVRGTIQLAENAGDV